MSLQSSIPRSQLASLVGPPTRVQKAAERAQASFFAEPAAPPAPAKPKPATAVAAAHVAAEAHKVRDEAAQAAREARLEAFYASPRCRCGEPLQLNDREFICSACHSSGECFDVPGSGARRFYEYRGQT